jgi:hypothetical protein
MFTRSHRARLVLLVCAIAAIALVPAASAKTTTVKFKKSGATTLKLDAGTASALTSLGITVGPVKPAKASSKGVAFPITGGSVNAKTLAGKIKHSGGLRFSKGSTVVELTDYTINIDKKPDLVATLGKSRVSILSLDLSKLKNKSSGKKIKLSGIKASLTAGAAAALNGAFGTTAFTEGLVLGTASVNGTVK